jgi:hypothetical protein
MGRKLFEKGKIWVGGGSRHEEASASFQSHVESKVRQFPN